MRLPESTSAIRMNPKVSSISRPPSTTEPSPSATPLSPNHETLHFNKWNIAFLSFDDCAASSLRLCVRALFGTGLVEGQLNGKMFIYNEHLDVITGIQHHCYTSKPTVLRHYKLLNLDRSIINVLDIELSVVLPSYPATNRRQPELHHGVHSKTSIISVIDLCALRHIFNKKHPSVNYHVSIEEAFPSVVQRTFSGKRRPRRRL